ncbi:serine/threonine-protein kinase [Haloplanus pelagicus]|uniref:serine/threonine-protein kinase n=1 Tax=Haloplanus pelagicus TaxID=2949995 RepID=UPI00203A6E7C|nr:serine/threonine-protein kinase [Haloplanus sp. HW8-1]
MDASWTRRATLRAVGGMVVGATAVTGTAGVEAQDGATPSLSASFSTVDGQVAVPDGTFSVSGETGGVVDEVAIVVGGEDGSRSLTVAPVTDRTFETEVTVGSVGEGRISASVLSEGADGNLGDGSNPAWIGGGDGGDSLEAYLDDLSADLSGDQVRARLVNATVSEAGSDDLMNTSAFRHRRADTVVENVYPVGEEAIGINPVPVGSAVVVEGTTNRWFDGNAITVAFNDHEGTTVSEARVTDWDDAGRWRTTLETPADAVPATYTIRVSDGASGDVVALFVERTATASATSTPTPTPTSTMATRTPALSSGDDPDGGFPAAGVVAGAGVGAAAVGAGLWWWNRDERDDDPDLSRGDERAAPERIRDDGEDTQDDASWPREELEHLRSEVDEEGEANATGVDTTTTAVSTPADDGPDVEAPGADRPGPPERIPRAPDVRVDYDALTDEEPIGGGGNADVTKATLPTPDGDVTLAIKRPRMQGTLHTDAVERLLAEAETWDKLDDHDHVVGVVDYGAEPLPWIAMEYMDGGHLGTRAGDLPFEQALWTALGITKGVRHAHRMGVAHLDLKPENVLFRSVEDAWDVPKVADWGLSKHLLEHSKSVEGLSPQYAAPEQFDDEFGSVDDITDVYQLGAVLYELFTGRPPFEGKPAKVMHRVLHEDPTPPSDVADLPSALDGVLLTALAREKADRYESVLYLRDALRDVTAD